MEWKQTVQYLRYIVKILIIILFNLLIYKCGLSDSILEFFLYNLALFFVFIFLNIIYITFIFERGKRHYKNTIRTLELEYDFYKTNLVSLGLPTLLVFFIQNNIHYSIKLILVFFVLVNLVLWQNKYFKLKNWEIYGKLSEEYKK